MAGVDGPFALKLESCDEGVPGGMLRFFSRYPPGAFCPGTVLADFTDEVALAVPDITYVLAVPSTSWPGVGSGGFLGEGFLLRGFCG